MKVTVLGAGAMGSLFGGRLQASGAEVELVDVWRAHVEAVNAEGLLIEQGPQQKRISIVARRPQDAGGPADLVLLFTKSMHTETALAGIKSILAQSTRVMTLQNGIGHVEIISRFVDPARIIHGVTTYPSDMVAPGHIRTSGQGAVKFMSLNGAPDPVLEQIAQMFTRAGLRCSIDPDTETAIWEKLAFNAVMNALSAILRLTVGEVGDAAAGRQLAENVVAEVAAVARRKAIAVKTERIMANLDMAFKEHRGHMPSMLQDILNRRPTEIDFINGAVVAAGEAVGLSLPVNATLTRLVKTLEQAQTDVPTD